MEPSAVWVFRLVLRFQHNTEKAFYPVGVPDVSSAWLANRQFWISLTPKHPRLSRRVPLDSCWSSLWNFGLNYHIWVDFGWWVEVAYENVDTSMGFCCTVHVVPRGNPLKRKEILRVNAYTIVGWFTIYEDKKHKCQQITHKFVSESRPRHQTFHFV